MGPKKNFFFRWLQVMVGGYNSRIVWLLYLVCTLSALVLACVLIGPLGLLWCWSVYCLAHTVGCELQMFDQETIVETTNERTAIDSK